MESASRCLRTHVRDGVTGDGRGVVMAMRMGTNVRMGGCRMQGRGVVVRAFSVPRRTLVTHQQSRWGWEMEKCTRNVAVCVNMRGNARWTLEVSCSLGRDGEKWRARVRWLASENVSFYDK